MTIKPPSKFTQFARQLTDYEKTGQFTPLLKKSCSAFEAALTSSSKTPYDAFKAKYHVPLHPESPQQPFSACIMKYMMLFRKMFPSQKVEAQAYGFQVKNEKENPFSVQWDLLKVQIEKKDALTAKLEALFCYTFSFDPVKEELNVLFDIGGAITEKAVKSALVDKDRRFLDPLLVRGYKPTLPDLDFVLRNCNEDTRAERAKMLVDAGVKVDASLAHHGYRDVKAMEFLVSLGHQLSAADLKCILKQAPEKAWLFIQFFKTHGYPFSEDERIDILARHFSKNCIEMICPEGKLTSALLHKMMGFAGAFIAHGYQPIFEDLKAAITANDEHAVKAMMPSFRREFTPEEALCVWSSSLSDSLKKEILRYTIITQELFRAALTSGEVQMKLIIQDNSTCDQYNRRANGPYEVTHSDIKFAISKHVSSYMLGFLIRCWSYYPSHEFFQEMLKEGLVAQYLDVLIEARFEVDSEDFRFACDLQCSKDTFYRLFHWGRERHGQDECIEYGRYTGRRIYEYILKYENAGYIPTQADLDYARGKVSDDALKLIESHLNRKRWGVWRDQYGGQRTYVIED